MAYLPCRIGEGCRQVITLVHLRNTTALGTASILVAREKPTRVRLCLQALSRETEIRASGTARLRKMSVYLQLVVGTVAFLANFTH